jgi:hypothetical protein
VLYFAYLGTFVGDMPPPPPPDANEEMVEVVSGQGPQLHIPLNMWRRPDLRYRMEVCDRMSEVLVGAGVHPFHMRNIRVDPDLLQLWMDLLHDMTSPMRHIIGVAILLVGMRDGTSSNTDDDEGGDDDHQGGDGGAYASVPPPSPPLGDDNASSSIPPPRPPGLMLIMK